MAITVTPVTHSGVLPDLAGQRPLTSPWFPDGAANWRLLAFTPDGWPETAGRSPSGHLGPPGQTPPSPCWRR